MLLSFRLLILWIHLLGVMVWIGGLIFQLLVVIPVLGRVAYATEQVRLGLSFERRFRAVMWPAVGVVLFTGLVNIMNVWYAVRQGGGTLPPPFVRVLSIKLLLVVGMIMLQAVQQFVVQPKRLALLKDLSAEVRELPPALVRQQRLTLWLQTCTVLAAVVVILAGLLLRG